jgi:DNA-binding PadR family transcriptional regulator
MNSPINNPGQYDTDQPSRGHRGQSRGFSDTGRGFSDTGHGFGLRGQRGGPEGRRRHGGFAPGFGPEFGLRGGGRGRSFGPGGPRGRRARRGDVRAAILSLLAQAPANGYALIQAISEQSNGAWKPSPGSVYPTLAQLVDEGLITPVDTVAPRSDYRLTDSGQAYVTEHAEELAATWNSLTDDEPLDATGELFQATQKLLGVLRQYAGEATADQQRAATAKLDDLRREFYRNLAE